MLAVPLVLASAAACTSSEDTPAAAPTPTPSTGASATMEAKPVPMVVRVTRVHGRLPHKAAEALEHNVGKVVGAFVDDAYLSGDYPRSDFGSSFGSFSHGVRGQARADADLLTNRVLGPTTESVTAKETSAYLSVLAPHKVAAGVSARVTVRYVADRGDKAAKQVTVTGRLSLTRTAGGWKIFGYDLARSVTSVGKGS